MKDLYCIHQGVPTLHDAAKSLGLKHDSTRTTEAILKRMTIHHISNILGFGDGAVRCFCGWRGRPWRDSEKEFTHHLKEEAQKYQAKKRREKELARQLENRPKKAMPKSVRSKNNT
jgi:hypothetical protein